jgi:hypothetical protein
MVYTVTICHEGLMLCMGSQKCGKRKLYSSVCEKSSEAFEEYTPT